MKLSLHSWLLLHVACPSVGAVVLQQRVEAPAQVIKLQLQRNQINNPIEHDRRRLGKRAGTVTSNLDNEETLYFLNASLGTPAQDLRLHLDTGSSDLWVNTPNSTFCGSRQDPCDFAGTYNANDSSTYRYLNSDFNISYVDGSGAAGDYATDTLRFSGQRVTNLQFGIGYESTAQQSILGVGYQTNEAQVARLSRQPYRNLPAQMVAQGLIARNVYSLWLDDRDANTGSILFGGVDHSRYDGNLVTVPVQRQGNTFSAFFISLTGVIAGSSNISTSDLPQSVLLDSGSSLTYLPDSITNSIYNMVNATYRQSSGVAYVACSLGTQDLNITFQFNSPATISVPMSELVLDLGGSGPREPVFNNEQACLFGIVPAGQSSSVLGDTFLRSAYVVYDLDNNQISLAQSNFNATSTTNVVAIQSGTTSIPSAVSGGSGSQSSDPGDSNNRANDGTVPHASMGAVLAGVVTLLAFTAGTLI